MSNARCNSIPLNSPPALFAPILVERVTAYLSPYDYYHDRYQSYYLNGILEALDSMAGRLNQVSLCRSPTILRKLRQIRHSYRLQQIETFERVGSGIDTLAHMIGGFKSPPSHIFDSLVGQYIFHFKNGRDYRVCIDSNDAGDTNPGLLEWCDLYFKTNRWLSQVYSKKVVPLANCNPLLLGQIDRLRSLRARPKEYDLCAIVRVWGGDNEIEGIEHNLRLIEELHRINRRKFLLAYLVCGDIPAIASRLQAKSIAYTTAPLPLQELWEISARSRLNVIRLGMHHCVPWRMMDLLAMGACPLMDRSPKTLWPQPLAEDTNFLSLNINTNVEDSIAFDRQYASISAIVQEIFSNEHQITHIGEANATYFDANLTPRLIGEYILGVASRRFNGKRPTFATFFRLPKAWIMRASSFGGVFNDQTRIGRTVASAPG